jgi:hypothetical protein
VPRLLRNSGIVSLLESYSSHNILRSYARQYIPVRTVQTMIGADKTFKVPSVHLPNVRVQQVRTGTNCLYGPTAGKDSK